MRVISTDDHCQEPPDLWTSRMSKQKWGDKIPQIRTNPDGLDGWYIYGQPYLRFGGRPELGSVYGVMPDRGRPRRWEDIPKIAYVPSERVKAMDQDGVDVHCLFGNVTGVAGTRFSDPAYDDEDFRLECIRAFNDFQIEEYAVPYPDRFITIVNVPMWDVKQAVAEVDRMAKRGVKAISFAFPQQYNYPDIADTYWDPFWAVAQETNLSVNLHIGSGGNMSALPGLGGNPSVAAISSNIGVMNALLFSGILERFPRLKVVSSESGLGWVPYLLELADHQWEQAGGSRSGLPLKPSEYFQRQCYVNFWYEVFGLKVAEYIGIDKIMWCSDFPHPTGTWPKSQEYIERSLGHLKPEDRQKILEDNAVKVFNL